MSTKINILLLSLCFLAGAGCNPSEVDPEPVEKAKAFPQAEGGGAYTTGGRNGVIYYVTSLNDDINEAGTLRYALDQTSTRYILFKVSGRIDLKSPLEIKRGNVTIVGQTAPGDGICISGYPVVVKANNVIIRFLRFRMGDLNGLEGDALTVQPGHKNIMIDHCSCSWSTDECVSVYGVENATVQYCFISESLNNSVHAKGAHGYGGIWGGKNASYHHNLLAHHSSRNPRFDHDFVDATCTGPIDYVNNVVYNWKSNSAYGGEGSTNAGGGRKINFVANYYKPGPATKSGVKTRLLNPTTKCDNVKSDGTHEGCYPKYGGKIEPGKFYLTDNYMDGSTVVTNDNWAGVIPDESSKKEQCKASQRWIDGLTTLKNEQSARQAYETVLAKAGCSLHRDAIDTRIVEEVRNGSYTYEGSNTGEGVKEKSVCGLIDTPSDVGGWPTYNSTPYPQDSDGDGMPDTWETEHGLNPNSYADGRATTLQPPYINLEVYLNDIVKHLY